MKKNILLIGIGGTGSNAVETFYKKHDEFGNQTDNKISALVFDTDAGDLKKITCAKTVVMADSASVGTICDRLGTEHLQKWFPCKAPDVRAQEMVRGASQWRKKSYLAFLNLMNKPANRAIFISALEDMIQDPSASCEVYVVASVAGGTGSGSFIPIALYAKRYLRKHLGKDPIVNAMIALPDIYAESQTPENKVKVYSNAYAILRELNAINLVARNYNAGLGNKKKAPIRFKIGDEKEPNVGVLFDASDKQYWTPEAAPFSQVFLLDRIPGLNSIQAHDMVLANSLYTILCTEIGAAFDSEFSNHELVRSQNNGSNAIYAGVSTSQIRFPHETILDYLAHKKTLESCESEWLILHKAVENTLREKEQEAKAAKRRFVMENSEYAKMILEAMDSKLEENNDEIISIVDRCVTLYGADKKPSPTNAGAEFVKVIEKFIFSRIQDPSAYTEMVKQMCGSKANKKIKNKKFVENLTATTESLFKYFKECFDTVKSIPISTADAIITLNKKKIGTIGDKYSLSKYLLTRKNGSKDEYIHPVAAMIRLCQFRVALEAKLKVRQSEWEELKKRNIQNLPERYMTNSENIIASGSAYRDLGEKRLAIVFTDKNAYLKKKTKVAADMKVLEQDAIKMFNNIYRDTQIQVADKVYAQIAADVDLLIAKYRNFFSRFEKEKESLEEETADALRKDAGAVDSVINVYSSKENKNAIAALVSEGNGPETDADILATDNIVGEGVFNAVFAAAVAERSEDDTFNANDSSAYRSLFKCMIDAYRTSIGKGEAFRNLASYNAIEALVASCGENAESKKIDDELRSAFSVAQDLAIPPIRIDPKIVEMDLVTPSNIMVFMLSQNTAKYIKRNAEKFGLKLPADQLNEKAVLRSCAEQFVRDYSGNTAARVAIVDSIPDHILYCTGEIMDITPLCITKFNELSEDPKDRVYFNNYTDALRRFRKYNTDMWSPHIGNDLHKRGHLPYMNPDMEKTCDEKMVKALLYAFSRDLIRYADGVGTTSYGKYYFVCGQNKILNSSNQPINMKNVAQLLDWMRNEDERIESWSESFDKDIKEQMLSLPSIISDSEVNILEGALTKSSFMRMLNEKLFIDNPATKTGPSAVEFAYLIKTNEEIDRDCDDAERILCVLFKIFKEIIAYRVNPETNPERFQQIYHQQLIKFYEAFAKISVVKKAGKNCHTYYAQLVEWMNQTELFLDIDENSPLDENGKVSISNRFEFHDSPECKNIVATLDNIAQEKKNSDKEENDAETGAVPEETKGSETPQVSVSPEETVEE